MFSHILIRATNWVGDAVMSLPALRAIRERCPDARISVLARPWVRDLYRREAFEEVIPCPDFRGASGLAARWRLARGLRARGFDAAILLTNSFDSALLVRMAGIPRRIGYARDGRGFLLTDRIAPPAEGEIPEHEVFYYLELLRRAGLTAEAPKHPRISLSGAADACRAGRELFDRLGLPLPVVGVSPGAQNSRAKQWLAERFAESAVAVARELGAAVAVFGSNRERTLATTVAEDVRRAGVRVLSLAGETTLAQFIDLTAACRVFITNDSGAMHIAAALDVPTVAIFGPTRWLATGPAGSNAQIVREPVSCSPCMLRDCPTDHRCMTRISAKTVAETALKLVK